MVSSIVIITSLLGINLFTSSSYLWIYFTKMRILFIIVIVILIVVIFIFLILIVMPFFVRHIMYVMAIETVLQSRKIIVAKVGSKIEASNHVCWNLNILLAVE